MEKFLFMSRLRELVNLETSFEYNAVAIATFTPGRERRTVRKRRKRKGSRLSYSKQGLTTKIPRGNILTYVNFKRLDINF